MENQWSKPSTHGPSIAPDLFQDRDKMRVKTGVITPSAPSNVVGKIVSAPSKDDKTHVKVFTKGFATGFTTGFTAGFTTGSKPKNPLLKSSGILKPKTEVNPTGTRIAGVPTKPLQMQVNSGITANGKPLNTIDTLTKQPNSRADVKIEQKKLPPNAGVIKVGKAYDGINVSIRPPAIYATSAFTADKQHKGIAEQAKTPENTMFVVEPKPSNIVDESKTVNGLKDQPKPQLNTIVADSNTPINENTIVDQPLSSNVTENKPVNEMSVFEGTTIPDHQAKHEVNPVSGQVTPIYPKVRETTHGQNAKIFLANEFTQSASKPVDLLSHDVAMKIPYDVDDKKGTVPKVRRRHRIIYHRRADDKIKR